MGAGAKSPSALAPFAHNWVGGNIHGLSAYAGTLYGYVPKLSDVATALDKKVSQIVGDAGWKGSAAAAFSKAWQHDATGATALAVMISAAGDIVNTLAVNLASIESALEAAADTTTAHGVPIGASGQPPQECFADATKESWRVSYQSFWNQSMLLAATARSQAAAALAQLGTAATEGGEDAGLGKGDYTALFDTLAGFFGAQTRYRAYVEGKLPGLKKSISKAITDAREEARQADGRFGPWSDEGKQNFGDAKSTLSSVQDDLAAAEKTENPFTKAWGFSPSDISSVGTKLEGLDGAGGGLARFAGDIPFVDIAAAGASTYFGAQDDMAKGVPGLRRLPGRGRRQRRRGRRRRVGWRAGCRRGRGRPRRAGGERSGPHPGGRRGPRAGRRRRCLRRRRLRAQPDPGKLGRGHPSARCYLGHRRRDRGQRREDRPGLREGGFRHRARGGARVGQHLLMTRFVPPPGTRR